MRVESAQPARVATSAAGAPVSGLRSCPAAGWARTAASPSFVRPLRADCVNFGAGAVLPACVSAPDLGISGALAHRPRCLGRSLTLAISVGAWGAGGAGTQARCAAAAGGAGEICGGPGRGRAERAPAGACRQCRVQAEGVRRARAVRWVPAADSIPASWSAVLFQSYCTVRLVAGLGNPRGARFCLRISPLGESCAALPPAPAAVAGPLRAGRSWCTLSGDAPSSGSRERRSGGEDADSAGTPAPGVTPVHVDSLRDADPATLAAFQSSPSGFPSVLRVRTGRYRACLRLLCGRARTRGTLSNPRRLAEQLCGPAARAIPKASP